MNWRENLAQLKELCAKGWSARRIAQFFGVPRNAVIGAKHRNGLSVTREQDLTRRASQRIDRQHRIKIDKNFKVNRARQATKFQFGSPKPKGPGRITFCLTALAPPPSNGTIPLLETKLGQCRWIYDDGLCCGHKTTTISGSWCPSHYRIVFVPSPYRPRPWRAVHG